ncbi:MAG: hypothetical protein ACI9HY_001614 [Planctomycetaceae bacterium]|jgi:hypothetical protein
MIPYPSSGLKMLADRVLGSVVPLLESKFAMSDTAMLAMLMAALAEEMEFGVARRLTDIESMKTLIQSAQAAGVDVPEPDLIVDNDYTLTRINDIHDAYTRTVISLHVEVENSEDFSEINRAIWQYLAAAAERHKLPL